MEEVVDLCKRVNAAKPEVDKIQQIVKGTDVGAFKMLLARNPHTFSEVVTLCQSYDELKKQRTSTRQPQSNAGSLSNLVAVPEPIPLLLQIEDFVREEIVRQLSLVRFTLQPSSRLPPSLCTVSAEEVVQAVLVAHH